MRTKSTHRNYTSSVWPILTSLFLESQDPHVYPALATMWALRPAGRAYKAPGWPLSFQSRNLPQCASHRSFNTLNDLSVPCPAIFCLINSFIVHRIKKDKGLTSNKDSLKCSAFTVLGPVPAQRSACCGHGCLHHLTLAESPGAGCRVPQKNPDKSQSENL